MDETSITTLGLEGYFWGLAYSMQWSLSQPQSRGSLLAKADLNASYFPKVDTLVHCFLAVAFLAAQSGCSRGPEHADLHKPNHIAIQADTYAIDEDALGTNLPEKYY